MLTRTHLSSVGSGVHAIFNQSHLFFKKSLPLHQVSNHCQPFSTYSLNTYD
ncbi:hypothetical protein HanIR_Chr16g0826231 [Helianthus annuus]|nr:hypothetical protein HanIR_Chr16g0826231 [Helianthus annuus]